jgi:hypothetical protein
MPYLIYKTIKGRNALKEVIIQTIQNKLPNSPLYKENRISS